MKSFDFEKVKSVHFIGVGGISMSALAKYCLKTEKKVSGSDRDYSPIIQTLKEEGVDFIKGHFKENVKGKDLVVYTSAIKDDNEELVEAKKSVSFVMSRAEFLGEILKDFKKTICVSGSHGKTTTTAMISRILYYAGYDPTIFLGGEDQKLSNFYYGKKDYAVVEACEYKKNFLHFKPYISVVLNIDNDHMDSFTSEQDMEDCFKKFCSHRVSIINCDDKRADKIRGITSVCFGIDNPAVYTAKNIKKTVHGYSFSAYAYQRKMGNINLRIQGRFNVYNALASIAVADILGVDFKHIKYALENFTSVKRRMEYIGKINGIKAYCDYAHHPKEIKSVLSVFNDQDFLVIFQPHTYSRTAYLMEEFVDVLKNVKNLIIYETYSAREEFMIKGSAKALKEKVSKKSSYLVDYAKNLKELKILLSNNRQKGVLFLGAGDIYEIAKSLTPIKK